MRTLTYAHTHHACAHTRRHTCVSTCSAPIKLKDYLGEPARLFHFLTFNCSKCPILMHFTPTPPPPGEDRASGHPGGSRSAPPPRGWPPPPPPSARISCARLCVCLRGTELWAFPAVRLISSCILPGAPASSCAVRASPRGIPSRAQCTFHSLEHHGNVPCFQLWTFMPAAALAGLRALTAERTHSSPLRMYLEVELRGQR